MEGLFSAWHVRSAPPAHTHVGVTGNQTETRQQQLQHGAHAEVNTAGVGTETRLSQTALSKSVWGL